MIDIDMSKYTQLCARDAVQLMRELIQKPPTHNGRTPLQTSALAMGFCSMKRRGRSDGANEFQSTLPARGATAQSNNSVDQNHRLCTKSIPQNSPFEN